MWQKCYNNMKILTGILWEHELGIEKCYLTQIRNELGKN